MQDFPQITARVDSEELARIKNQLALRDRVNSDRYELTRTERENPTVLYNESTSPGAITQSTMRGLKYPLELDGRGGLKLSSNYDRIGEQIMEVLQTRIGERIYRPFFGVPELIFETIDEYSLAQSLKTQLRGSLPVIPELEVKVSLEEDGSATAVVLYSVEGSEQGMVRYSFSL